MAEALPPAEEVHLLNGKDREWTSIGKLIELITYPIDSGFGFTSETATVKNFGMVSMNFAQMTFSPFRLYHFKMEDRTLIPFKYSCAELFNRRIAEIRHLTIINELDMGERRKIPHKINYLSHPTDIYNIDLAATQHHINMSRDIIHNLPCDFGFLPQNERWDNFNNLVQEPNDPNEINNGYLANYSPFMLINKKSLEELRKETDREDLFISDFRPNFVIDATTPFCEENITHLKIGSDVEFHKIIPCTHSLTKIIRNGEEEHNMLFQILQKRYSINVKHPRETDSRLPSFGINMQAKEVGEVAIGDEVYAQFKKSLDD